MKNYQHKTELNFNIRAVKESEYEELGVSKASLLTEASSLIPEDHLWQNIDIMPIVLSVAKVNKFNDNDDAVPPLGAAKMLPLFAHKPINIEHDKRIIVGHMVRAGFSDFEPAYATGNPLDYLDRTDEFYIAALGYIYSSVYPELAEAIRNASDPYHESYNAYAGSWEVAFNSYDVAVGGENLISECSRIITPEDPEYQSYSAMLKVNKGTGRNHEGVKVRRILRGEKVPVGLALTENPAAEVTGILALASIQDKKISKKEEINVTDNEIDVAMTDEQLKELKDAFKKELAQANIGADSPSKEAFDRITALLEEKGKDWQTQTNKTAEELNETKATLQEFQEKLEAADKTIKELQSDVLTRDASDRLNDRMAALAAKYDFTDEEKSIIGQEVASLPAEDKSFEDYLAKTAVIFAHRDREAIAAKLEEAEASKKEEKEEKEENVSGELETLETKASPLLNNIGQDAEGKSLFQRLQSNGLELETTK